MEDVIYTLSEYLSLSYVRRALIVGIIIAFCASLLGVTLVLKRYSYIGDGLSHVAFAAMAVATITGFTNNMLLVMPLTVIAAVLMLRTGQNAKINGDAVIAMISVGSLAVGYLLMNLFSTSSNLSGDVCSTLFGSISILTLNNTDVWLCVIMSVVVLLYYLVFYHKIFAVTFDENFAHATGIKTGAYNLAMAIITAIVIVLAMNLVGSLLISALVIFPALSAMRVFKNFKSVIICSAILSVCCAVCGFFVSLLNSTPVGATIVAVDIVAFFVFYLVGIVTGRARD